MKKQLLKTYLIKFLKMMFNLNILFKISLFVWLIFIPMKTSFYQISYALMILLFLIYIFTNKKVTQFTKIIYEQKTILIAFSFVILSMTISNLLSPTSTYLSWKTEFYYVFRYLFIFLILLFFYKEKFFTKKNLIIVIFISLLLQGVDGIFQAIFHYDFIKGNEGDLQVGLTGATFSRNTFGMFMALGASLSIGFILFKKQFKLEKNDVFLLSIIFFIFIFNLMFSYSRASWLFFVVFTFILFLLNYKKITKYQLLFLIFFLSISVMIFISNQNLLMRFNSLLEGYSSHRFEIWSHTIDMIKQKLLFGNGLMTFSDIGKIGGEYYSGVHNSILEILFFLGLFGFIAYANLIWKILKKIISNKSTIQIALFFAFLTITQFDQSIIKGIASLSSLTVFSFFIFTQEQKNIMTLE